jgi:hypothetical protein
MAFIVTGGVVTGGSFGVKIEDDGVLVDRSHARERELTLRLPRLEMEASAVPSFCKGFNVVVNGGLGRT